MNDILTVGDVFSVRGEHGRFVMRAINPDGSIKCWGGRVGHEMMRDFRPTRVSRIHRPKKARKKTTDQ